MAKRRDRCCERCGETVATFSKALYCSPCKKSIQREANIVAEKQLIIDNGYLILEGPINHERFDNKRIYKVKTPCGHEWTTRLDNFRKAINLKKPEGPMPCGTCGPKHRMNTALKGYLEKYARDYNLADYQDYSSVVRGLSDKMYKMFKKEINPDNHRRGAKLYHLDHIIPIIECFKRGWPIEQAAHPDNLQMLFWYDNLCKSAKVL